MTKGGGESTDFFALAPSLGRSQPGVAPNGLWIGTSPRTTTVSSTDIEHVIGAFLLLSNY